MSELKLIRKVVTANTPVTFEFDVPGIRFLVKNLSGGVGVAGPQQEGAQGGGALISSGRAVITEAGGGGGSAG